MDGRFVHRWQFVGFSPSKGELLPNGNLLVIGIQYALRPTTPPPEPGQPYEPFEARIRRLGANASQFLEVNWDGEVVWHYENQAIHHDVKRLPNGNTIFPEWVELPEDLTRAVKGGTRVPKEKLPPNIIGDDFVEIDVAGTEVRRIETWKPFDPKKDATCPLEGRLE